MEGVLNKKLGIITGAARGLGAATCEEFRSYYE